MIDGDGGEQKQRVGSIGMREGRASDRASLLGWLVGRKASEAVRQSAVRLTSPVGIRPLASLEKTTSSPYVT